MINLKRTIFFVVMIFGVGIHLVGLAQTYPTKTIKIVVPFAPGGPSDIIARILSQKLSENLNTPVIVENKPGAGANIGMVQVARSAPDGYTLLLVSSSFVINPSLYDKPGYDALKDFTAVALPVTSPNILVGNPGFAAKNVKELLELIKANPGKYDYASPGAGTGPHLSMELLKLKLGLDIKHIPYNGGGPALQAVLGNQVPIGFSALPPAVQQIKAGKLIGLALSSVEHFPLMPEIPTLIDAGVKDFEGDTMQFIMAPQGTPSDIVKKLNTEISNIVSTKEIQEKLSSMGYFIYTHDTKKTDQIIRSELNKWQKVVQAGNIKPD
ncbi:MAG: tripartite tricarboxylate transporter substrate binding protein [Betaproteobacteria bacterium]